MCIGEIGLSKDEYWNLTPAETYTKVQGYVYNKQVEASNFRALFSLQFNQWSKHPKSPEQLWPLPLLDNTAPQLSIEEIYERNKRIIEQFSNN